MTRLLACEGKTVPEQQHEDPIAPWVADGMKKQPDLGRVLGLLRELMGPYWRYVEQVTWVGTRGEAVFKPTDQEGPHLALLDGGYTSDYFAKRGSDKWGVREPRKRGAALHWSGNGDGTVNVHIDLDAPSGTGLWHWIEDDVRRFATHTPDSPRGRGQAASRGVGAPAFCGRSGIAGPRAVTRFSGRRAGSGS
ncbi:MAG: hypothetical protein JOY89_24205 [Solirubrobacterales bacterium]|nr:hypothetical protein [Solirubrobacterales bacterium]